MRSEMPTPDLLNSRQRLFVARYASGMAAGRAYEASGYAARGPVADTQASKLLRNPKVAQAIQNEKATNRRLTNLGRMQMACPRSLNQLL